MPPQLSDWFHGFHVTFTPRSCNIRAFGYHPVTKRLRVARVDGAVIDFLKVEPTGYEYLQHHRRCVWKQLARWYEGRYPKEVIGAVIPA